MGYESFGGEDIFGTAVSIQAVASENAEQQDTYFGVDGKTTTYGGSRGYTFHIRGVFVADTIEDLVATEQLFRSYGDSIARTLVDPIGRVFANVYFRGQYTPSAEGNKFLDSGAVCLPYTATFYGLTT